MVNAKIEERLCRIIPSEQLNEWEKDELIENLSIYDEIFTEKILDQIAVIWPVSPGLCFSFLEELARSHGRMPPESIADWVKSILDAYEVGGLRSARLFMADFEKNFIRRLPREGALLLSEIEGKLLPYVRGLSGKNLMIAPSTRIFTDTTTLFMPEEIFIFKDKNQNFLAFKLIATFHWALLEKDLYCHNERQLPKLPGSKAFCAPKEIGPEDIYLDQFFSQFPHREFIQDIYHHLQLVRVVFFLKDNFTGLMTDARHLFERLRNKQATQAVAATPSYIIETIRHWLLSHCGQQKIPIIPHELGKTLSQLRSPDATTMETLESTVNLYSLYCAEASRHERLSPLLFQGELRLRAAHNARLLRRENNRQQFIEALSVILPPPVTHEEDNAEPADEAPLPGSIPKSSANVTAAKSADKEMAPPQGMSPEEIRFITLDDRAIELPEELRKLAREIENDLGNLPSLYISSARQMSGGSSKNPQKSPRDEPGKPLPGENTYDEWDFRRKGFRKNWCRLIEKKVIPAKGTFVASTLEKYRGQLIQLKRQFEMMRTQYRFVKRQRDGDEIDLDATIEAYGDQSAGFTPSDRLFIRLLRDERDIATLFLVDMSSSTEGWVCKTLKEALVLLSESLKALGDRYAIYGFSGMRRTRNEIFHVKAFDEPYDDAIRDRIAGISPMDYTRMGPPIRWATEMLSSVEARIRLLVILTDGKPEDYDDYKGEYAIEDTRHALIEAKLSGIHAFCITIDKEAQEYMSHMFGEINYTFINDVRKLPLRVPEIYRTLTS